MDSRKVSNTFYVIRFFALISIVLAHSTFYEIPNEYAVKILHAFGRCGAVIFFVSSGYYFNPKKYSNILKMLKDKAGTIMIPWAIWGIETYCIRFAKEPFYLNPVEIITYLLGCGTYLWFLTIWIVLHCIFQVIPNKKYLLFGLIAINILAVFLTANNIGRSQLLPVGSRNTIYLSTYLNIFNWIGFFSVGILLKQFNLLEKFGHRLYGKNKWLVLTIIPLLLASIILEKDPSYWTYYSIFIEISFFLLLLVLSVNISYVKVFQKIGAVSFPIYLLHMQIQGFLFNKIFPHSIIMGCLRPFATVFCICLMLWLGSFISKKVGLEKVYKLIFGLKH